MSAPPPPPPPPHGESPKSSGLPPGNYDIFIIPPHSSGSGFLYLPSLQTHRNSFLAGVACTLGVVGLWVMIAPTARHVYQNYVTTSGVAMAMVLCGFSFAAYHIGSGSKFSNPASASGPPPNPGAAPPPQQQQPPPPNPGHNQSYNQSSHQPPGSGGAPNGAPPPQPQPQPGFHPPPPPPPGGANYTSGASTAGAKPSWQRTNPASASGWEKAREEMRKAQEEKRRKEEAEKKAKEAAEKERWEKATARAKELREKLAREKEAKEKAEKARLEKEKLEKERAERAAAAAEAIKERERKRKEEQEEKARSAASSAAAKQHNYQKPSASSYLGEEDAYSYRPYDKPSKHAKSTSQSSFYSASSYAASQTTARTTPPPSHRGPYVNKDPDKITIKAVYAYTDLFPKPVAELVSGTGNVTDGLVLKMTTEGLFIDDDVRGVPQREWDVRAWTMKLVENGDMKGKHVLRATIRDAENKKYVFIIDEAEAWKVAVGLQRVRRGSQVRSLNVSGLSQSEMRSILTQTGWA